MNPTLREVVLGTDEGTEWMGPTPSDSCPPPPTLPPCSTLPGHHWVGLTSISALSRLLPLWVWTLPGWREGQGICVGRPLCELCEPFLTSTPHLHPAGPDERLDETQAKELKDLTPAPSGPSPHTGADM